MSEHNAIPGPQRGRTLTPADLQSVADVYRRAAGTGQPVNEAVREAFGLSKDGASKRIMRARKAGFLEDVDRLRHQFDVPYGEEVPMSLAVSRDMMGWLDAASTLCGLNRSQFIRGLIADQMRERTWWVDVV